MLCTPLLHLPFPPLPPTLLPLLPGCSPAGGPVIPAAPLCVPAGISPASAEQQTQLTGSAVGAGGVLLLEARLPYFLSISQALLETQNNKDEAICHTNQGTAPLLRFMFQTQCERSVDVCVLRCLAVSFLTCHQPQRLPLSLQQLSIQTSGGVHLFNLD